jgi:3-hydroxyisobutyrate dehydrogenase-like beta-hydroxyacid dehydrogenase
MNIGFMGVGYMGHGAARNILAKGYALTVLGNRNRVPVDDLVAQGASEASSPADLARRCDIVFTCLPSSVQVEEAVLGGQGFLKQARPGFILVDSTTADPLSTRRLGAALRDLGADLVDAPMGRTPKEAEEGRLACFVGGQRASVDRVLPIVRCFADTIVETGELGTAHTIKLINNFQALATAAVVSEAIAAAMALGVDLNIYRSVVETGGANSVMFQRCIQYPLSKDDSAMQASMHIAQKDLSYYGQMAAQTGLRTDLATQAAGVYQAAIAVGKGSQFVPTLASILASVVDGKTRELPLR